jgi:LPS export ABC transporter protein LptC/lipopolysaccharide transport protein LptA
MNLKKILVMTAFYATLASSLYAEESVSSSPSGDQKIKGFNLQGYSDNGDKAWDVNGDTADVNGSKVTLSNVDANSYGEEKINVTADKGTIDQASGNMQLNKDVIVTSERGTQLITDSLNWSREKDLVSTSDPVIITDKAMMVKGKGMEAKPGLKNATIQEDVTVRMNTEPKKIDGRYVTVTSDGPMTIDQVKLSAIFEDNVVAIQADKMIKADKMEVHFLPEMKGIKEMVCLGNVEIYQGENKTYAEKATYDAATQKVTLSGRPKLIMLTDEKNGISAFTN